MRQDNSTTESLKASAKTEDSSLFDAMVAEDGPLAAGSLPAVRAASEAGCKKLLQSLDEEGKQVVKKAKKVPKTESPAESEPVKPKTCLESGHPAAPSKLF